MTASASLPARGSTQARSVVLLGPIAPPNWGPAVKNRILLDALQEFGVDVIPLNTLGWKRHPLSFAAGFVRRVMKTRRVFLSVSRGGRWTLLPPLAVMNLILGVRTMFLPAGGLFAQDLKSLPPGLRGLYLWCTRRCSLVCVQTRQAVQGLQELGLSNAILLPNFKRCPELGSPVESSQGALRIVYVSRVRPEKGIETLFEALDGVRDIPFSLDIYGILRDDYKAAFETLLAKRPYARYGGVLESSELIARLSQCDIMVFPTLCESEGFPGVLADAALAGLPVIASNVAANAEIIQDGFNGLLAKPGDAGDWAAKLRRVMCDDQLRATLAANNKASSKNFTVDTVIRGTLLHELDRRGFWAGNGDGKTGGPSV